jgi:hypothetical protein
LLSLKSNFNTLKKIAFLLAFLPICGFAQITLKVVDEDGAEVEND